MEVHGDATLAEQRSREVKTGGVVTEVICTEVTTETTEHREGTETREWQARDPRSGCASEQTGQRPEEGEATEEVAPSRPGLASAGGWCRDVPVHGGICTFIWLGCGGAAPCSSLSLAL